MSNQNKSAEEDNCECFTRASNKPCPPIRNVTHPLRYYEFTQDELKALEECDKESFYQRCLPFSTLFASLTYAAIKFGFTKRDPNFGVVPKVMLSALLGHVYGRLTYIAECDEKLRKKLPGSSHLGRTMQNYYNERNPPPKI
ncbi:OCIA domain-containing protein 1-like [Hyposmocoma kahamanoa]|uniref:OCIA domain-containing protein 1-like n=1 Tax=Hyposmocoma kahamanoa TaxID=1477025 RepID=UPI000E6D982B|nr:OCIA domain-containing protein 1-like [Hyposmocoma kahamanoa]